MHIIRCFILSITCILFFISLKSFAQTDPEFELLSKNEDIAILKEQISYTFSGVRTFSINLIVDRSVEYKILTSRGIEKLEQIILPEPIDETYFIHSTDIRKLSSKLDNSTVLSFSGEIISSDKLVNEIKNNPEVIRSRVLTEDGFFGLKSTYSIDIPNLKVGDIVKISYKISVPFKDNTYALMLSRFYFHRKYPVKSLDFSFSHNKALQADITFVNNCEVIPTLSDEYKKYNWHFENLPGCLGEDGSRSYTDLPWFSFHLKLDETNLSYHSSDYPQLIQPWFMMAGNAESRIEVYLDEYERGVNNQDNSGFNKTALKFSVSKIDSINNLRLWAFQKWMSDSIKYHPDTSYYMKDEDHLLSKPGADLHNGIVRDHHINSVYAAMIPRLGYRFMNAYLADKRVGTVSPSYFASLHSNDVLFGIPINETISYIIPTSDRNHYYFEELPFYYEDVPAIMLYPSNFKSFRRNNYDSTRIVTTPGSLFSENLRNLSCMTDVNTTTMNLTFSSRLILSGQYSTLTRSIYLGNLPDMTINPLYHKKLWEIGGVDKSGSFLISGNECSYPYKTTIIGNYVSKALKKENDSIFEIDIAYWFNHIIYPELTSENRTTDFYPDFTGSDKYFYQLSFDKEIKLVDSPSIINIQNSMGTYVFNIAQNDKNKVLITSFFITSNNKIPAASINDVVEIYNAIKSRKEFKIKFNVKQ
ncbi:MAG: DUF3857 domain-containing protein [Bacteroidota bacterium]